METLLVETTVAPIVKTPKKVRDTKKSIPPGHTTFLERQETNKRSVNEFFASQENYNALEAIIQEGENICSVIMYFVTEYSKNRVYQIDGDVFCPNDSYRYALRSHLKRFYDFENRIGQGDLWYNGVLNPRVVANEERGPLALSLPRLVALQWFIKNKFDVMFWQRYPDVLASYDIFVSNKKQKYTETHKAKKKMLRQQIEAGVLRTKQLRKIEMTIEKAPKKQKTKKKKIETIVRRKETRLSRVERRLVVEMISL